MGLLNPGWSKTDREHCSLKEQTDHAQSVSSRYWQLWIQNTLFGVTCANLEKKNPQIEKTYFAFEK